MNLFNNNQLKIKTPGQRFYLIVNDFGFDSFANGT